MPEANPTLARLPTRAWVVETGSPRRVATRTVEAAAQATTRENEGVPVSSVPRMPSPPKRLRSPFARGRAAADPSRVIPVA